MLDLSALTNDEVLESLRDLLDDGMITQDEYFKGVVGVAADMAKDGDIVLAYVTLAIPPPEYFSNVQLRQMLEDPIYAEVASGLAGRLMRYGFSNMQEIAPTQATGEA